MHRMTTIFTLLKNVSGYLLASDIEQYLTLPGQHVGDSASEISGSDNTYGLIR
jgi:hypothetical protein